LVCFAIQWLAFIPAWIFRTERYFDLIGGLSFLSALAIAVGLSTRVDTRSWLVVLLVGVWAVRLSSFLFLRIRKAGFDRRFVNLKRSYSRFLMTWTLQGLWVYLTLAPTLVVLTGTDQVPLGYFALGGLVLWGVGFFVEVISDRQKSEFNAQAENRGTFIRSGLWSVSRHPNYFGEILLWLGIGIIAIPILEGWQWATLISPLFVYVQLTKVSGIPLLEGRERKKWGNDFDYQNYIARTPALWPKRTSRSK
jgi:steroid 5-alpha reductase family enzyme